MTRLRIATWNLQRPRPRSKANTDRLSRTRLIDADICVFTETSSVIALDRYSCAASDKAYVGHKDEECAATIWSRFPIVQPLPTRDSTSSVCAEVESPIGPIIVYGTIITYANDRAHGTARRWEEHRKAITRQAADWSELRERFPSHHFVLAGDFNQSRDGSGWYEEPVAVHILTEALRRTELTCATETDFRRCGLLKSRASVDHIRLSKNLNSSVGVVGVWEGTSAHGVTMSDHNGVYIYIA
jgi:hypothetical protein